MKSQNTFFSSQKLFPNIIFFLFEFLILIILLPINLLSECPEDYAIRRKIAGGYGGCEGIYCTEEEFNEGICIIDNAKVKAKWLSNILTISTYGYRYVNFAKTQTDDLFIVMSSYPKKPNREFYGITKIGRGFFVINETEYTHHVIDIDPLTEPENGGSEDGGRTEAEVFAVRLSAGVDKGKEYVISIGKHECYAELFDLDTYQMVWVKKPKDFLNSENHDVFSKIYGVFEIDKGSEYHYVIGFLADDTNPAFYLRKIILYGPKLEIDGYNGYNFLGNNPKIDVYTADKLQKMVSCYQNENKKIVCFIRKLTDGNPYEAVIYNEDLDFLGENIIYGPSEQTEYFKCIHYKGNIELFFYYKLYDTSIYHPEIQGKILHNYDNSFSDFPESAANGLIQLNKYPLLNKEMLSDIILYTKERVSISAIDNSKEKLYIIILNIYNDDKKVKIRYYEMKIFKYHQHKIFLEMKLSSWNNFMNLTFS